MKNNYKKFSLIELIIVIAILAILASMLMPSLRSSYLAASRLSCSKNLQQIGLAVSTYAEDFDNYITSSHIVGSIASRVIYTNLKWKGRFHEGKEGYLVPYLGDDETAYVCPGAEFKQGLAEFAKTGTFAKKIATYTSFSFVQYGTRKLDQPHFFFASDRNNSNYLELLDKRHPVYLDPMRQLPGWGFQKDGRWDLNGSVIHGNIGTIPVLMSDFSVTMFDRSQYLPIWSFARNETFNIIKDIINE